MTIDPKKHHLECKALDFIPQYYEGLDTYSWCAIPPIGALVFLVGGQRLQMSCGGFKASSWLPRWRSII
jgi:hypothetical protein